MRLGRVSVPECLKIPKKYFEVHILTNFYFGPPFSGASPGTSAKLRKALFAINN